MSDDEEYTPTTDQVRNAYGWSPHDNFQTATRRAAEAAFDRWLAEVIRENRAIGWDEGHMAATDGFQYADNPYRKASDDAR